MKVELVNATSHALETLIFTKNTRLRMDGVGFDDITNWPQDRKLREWEYMKKTIQSSWEFCDYIFSIQVVTRAFTHQLVRHRVGTSFAQQSQRTVDMTGFDSIPGPSITGDPIRVDTWERLMEAINAAYHALVEDGVPVQDARGVLPTNVATSIVFKANLRTLHEMARKRLCVKTQGEFQDVFRAMKAEVIKRHPWTEDVLQPECGWNGTCLFPSYPTFDCPVKPYVYNPESGKAYDEVQVPWPLVQIRRLHETVRAEAQTKVVKSS